MPKLFLGTCGFLYDSWRGLVYKNETEINYLKQYSDYFETVDIEKWYNSLHGNNKVVLPKPETISNYKNSVHKDFKFTIRIPNCITLTHLNNSENEEELIPNAHFLSKDLLDEFVKILKPMKWNLGVLIFQFDYLSKQKIKSQYELQGLMREFISTLPEGFRFAIETRNSDFQNENYFQFIRDSKIGNVFFQGLDMPDVVNLYHRYKDYIKDYAVINLYGDDRKGIETRSAGQWNKIILSKDDELKNIAEMINELLERGIDVYLYVHNYYEGSAPITILRLQKILSELKLNS